jgi:hypothetical protein
LSQRRDQPALNIDPEALATDWPVEHPWRIDAVAAQGGEEAGAGRAEPATAPYLS